VLIFLVFSDGIPCSFIMSYLFYVLFVLYYFAFELSSHYVWFCFARAVVSALLPDCPIYCYFYSASVVLFFDEQNTYIHTHKIDICKKLLACCTAVEHKFGQDFLYIKYIIKPKLFV